VQRLFPVRLVATKKTLDRQIADTFPASDFAGLRAWAVPIPWVLARSDDILAQMCLTKGEHFGLSGHWTPDKSKFVVKLPAWASECWGTMKDNPDLLWAFWDMYLVLWRWVDYMETGKLIKPFQVFDGESGPSRFFLDQERLKKLALEFWRKWRTRQDEMDGIYAEPGKGLETVLE
jgi:hypothetical protein